MRRSCCCASLREFVSLCFTLCCFRPKRQVGVFHSPVASSRLAGVPAHARPQTHSLRSFFGRRDVGLNFLARQLLSLSRLLPCPLAYFSAWSLKHCSRALCGAPSASVTLVRSPPGSRRSPYRFFISEKILPVEILSPAEKPYGIFSRGKRRRKNIKAESLARRIVY